MHRSDMYTHSPSLSSHDLLRHLQSNSLENDVLLLEARPFAMELQRQLLTSQTLTKLEPRNLAKTCSSMGYLAVIDSVTSEVPLSSGFLDGKDVMGIPGEFPKGYRFGWGFVYLCGGFLGKIPKKRTWMNLECPLYSKTKKRWMNLKWPWAKETPTSEDPCDSGLISLFQATFPMDCCWRSTGFISFNTPKIAVGGHLQRAGSKAGDLANKAVVHFSRSMLFFLHII